LFNASSPLLFKRNLLFNTLSPLLFKATLPTSGDNTLAEDDTHTQMRILPYYQGPKGGSRLDLSWIIVLIEVLRKK
jgi:hypothetical protein